MTPYLRDPFGLNRLLYHPGTGAVASSIQQVLHLAGIQSTLPDTEAIQGIFLNNRLPGRTVVREVCAVPPEHRLEQAADAGILHPSHAPFLPRHSHLKTSLCRSLAQAIDSGKRVALALSGGLDSALLLALLKDMGANHIPAYVLATGMPDYCERAPAQALAAQLGFTCHVVSVDSQQFVKALPETIQHVEEPLFNLHPVAKLLLADALAQDGIELVITGDGADQVLRRDQSANYLPLCQCLFQARQLKLHPPVLDDAVMAHLLSLPPDPDKLCLRHLARQLPLPDRLVNTPKHGRLAPPMDLGSLLDRQRIQQLAAALNMPAPQLELERERVLWTTLLLALDHLNALPLSMRPA